MIKHNLKLFICGMSLTSEQAMSNLRQLLREHPNFDCELIIVDVLERPDIAETEGIVATPSLLRELPTPRQLIVGDLSDADSVKRMLGLADNVNEESIQ
jgi:circadian clock protein KaiB